MENINKTGNRSTQIYTMETVTVTENTHTKTVTVAEILYYTVRNTENLWICGKHFDSHCNTTIQEVEDEQQYDVIEPCDI